MVSRFSQSAFIYFLFVSGALFLCAEIVKADEAPVGLGAAVQAAVELIEREHLTQRSIDDDLSRKWLRSFLVQLDPRRLYFLESDLQEFRRFEDRLDDQAKAGDAQFPDLVR